MDSTPNTGFAPGEALTLTTLEGGFATKRGVEFISISGVGNTATVKWGLETHTVALADLSRPERPTHPAWLPKPFEVRPPPTPPSEEQLQERLAAARSALAKTHQHVRDVQIRLDQAKAVVDRASKDVETKQAALRVHDQHQKAAQLALLDSLRTGRPAPALTNGHDPGHYLTEQCEMAEKALATLQGEMADQMGQMNAALASVRRTAADIVALMVQREVEALRRLEIQAAVTRAELLAVASNWFGGAEIGPLRLPAVTTTYLEQQPAFQDVMEVRSRGPEGRIKPWQSIFDKLVIGDDVEADFVLGD